MNRSPGARRDDAIEVNGISSLLHPDSHPGQLELTLRCNGYEYAATVVGVTSGWTLLLKDSQGTSYSSGLDTTQDAAIVSALLSVLNAAWLQASTDY